MKQLTLPFPLEKRILDRQRRNFYNIGDLKAANHKPINTSELMLAQLEALDTGDSDTIRFWLREDYLSFDKPYTPSFDLGDAVVLNETGEMVKLLLDVETTEQAGLYALPRQSIIDKIFVNYNKLEGPEFKIKELIRAGFLADDPTDIRKDLPIEKVLESPVHEALARDKRLLREFARRMYVEILRRHQKGDPNFRYRPHLLMGFDLHGYNPGGTPLSPADRYGPNRIYPLHQTGINTRFQISQTGLIGHNGVMIGFKQT